jgi:hypothetical protein
MPRHSFNIIWVAIGAAIATAGCHSAGALISFEAEAATVAGARDYCIALGTDGSRRFGRRYGLAEFPLPQTLGVTPAGHGDTVARLDVLRGGLRSSTAGLGVDFGPTLVDAAVSLSACVPATATATLNARGPIVIRADRIVLQRTGAEPAGGAQLVGLAGSGGARYRFEGATATQVTAAAVENGASSPVEALLSFDVDGDCADDLLVAPAGLSPSLWPSAVDGAPTPAANRLPSLQAATSMVAADLDGDGWADLALGGDDGITVLLSDGVRSFRQRSNPADIQPTGVRAVALGDFNGDGILDLVVGGSSGSIFWLRGEGDGGFRLQMPGLPGSWNTQRLVALDYDGDGDVDLVAAVKNGAPGGVRVFANDGKGVFSDATSSVVAAMPDASVVDLVVADLDGDCVDELIAIGELGPPLWLVWNGGHLLDRGEIGELVRHSGAAADVDGDGTVDLALAGDDDVTVFSRAMP